MPSKVRTPSSSSPSPSSAAASKTKKEGRSRSSSKEEKMLVPLVHAFLTHIGAEKAASELKITTGLKSVNNMSPKSHFTSISHITPPDLHDLSILSFNHSN
jgi:hypothetical protein